ncbi:Ldh family oxidoreductase [Rhizobium leucaenae]|uniref:LDH2 family malate/lactate/ureidoglycolate dehydrogenase n=1 Tax=Rhizobium leucaenae TaxID=29450 RepID=A0A7W7ENL6_9HYPH|nr:Ldh family oxidoreductase [Rhizobium leucaenae]MBB4571712.1 LDH2 family malate/lactate/ureidoglycolate dehydrogenase [Rhizobium leucaenae]MBB6305616.1 LDH2 family malate/lactate/ureidoglycolate dehydrogenase [Rhizobium leucaenae]
MVDEVFLTLTEAKELAMRACLAVGAAPASAHSLVEATLSAALHGPATLGFPHFVDYLNGFIEGRIKVDPAPRLERNFPAFLVSDADRGIAQLGFDLALDDLLDAVRTYGVAVFTQTNSFTTGELGYYVRTLANHGVIGLAVTNANAMVASKPGGPAVYSTNPMAFGFPLGPDSPPMVIDQASSATALVNVIRAAEENQPIPEGWAVDADGKATTDANKALSGALLPFGGRKGGNVALFVEMLSAGLSGGNWSLDVPDFRSGSTAPAVGLTVVAIMPGKVDDGRILRAHAQSQRLQEHGVFVPGVTGVEHPVTALGISIPQSVFERISAIASK